MPRQKLIYNSFRSVNSKTSQKIKHAALIFLAKTNARSQHTQVRGIVPSRLDHPLFTKEAKVLAKTKFRKSKQYNKDVKINTKDEKVLINPNAFEFKLCQELHHVYLPGFQTQGDNLRFGLFWNCP